MRLLGDMDTYIKLKRDPVIEYTKDLKTLLNQALLDAVLTKNEYHFLYNRHALTLHFYHIPKMHKSEVDPLGRPILRGSTVSPAMRAVTLIIFCKE